MKRALVAVIRFLFSRWPLRYVCGHWLGWKIQPPLSLAWCRTCGKMSDMIAVRANWSNICDDLLLFPVRFDEMYLPVERTPKK